MCGWFAYDTIGVLSLVNWIDARIVGYILFGRNECVIENMAGGFIMIIDLLLWTWLAIYLSQGATGENVWFA